MPAITPASMPKFQSAEAMRAHYGDIRKRLVGKLEPMAKPKPKPVVVIASPSPKPRLKRLRLASITAYDKAIDIGTEIAARHGLVYADLRDRHDKSRTARFVRPRQQWMFALFHELNWSAARIGRFLDMDHSSVLHGIKRISREMRAQ